MDMVSKEGSGERFHTNQLLSFSILADNETSLDMSVASQSVLDTWCNGIDIIRQLTEIEKESFFWFYCNQKEERIQCIKLASLSRNKVESSKKD